MSGRKLRTAAVQLAVTAAVAAPLLTMAGCHERKYNQYLHARDTVTLNAGDAVAHNKAVHTIDPWPAYARDPSHTTDGKRMKLAIERYQENRSLEPQGLTTNDVFGDQEPPEDPGGAAPQAAQ